MHIINNGQGVKMASVFSVSDAKKGLTFFTDDSDFLQVGSWNYQHGKKLLAHNHNIVERTVNRTQEFIFIAQGSLKASVYDEDDQLLEDVILEQGGCMICHAGGHGYEILSDDTVVMEIKNGPYMGADRDRRRLEEH